MRRGMREENRTHFSLSALDPGALEIYIRASVSLKLHQLQPLRIAHRYECGSGRASALNERNLTVQAGGVSMTNAQCACGALRLMLNEPPQLTALCHCFACQRRTGAPFSANAFYSIDCVEISGVSTEYVRTAESGRKVRMHFCPSCGSTVYWRADASPSWIGVAVGSFADPAFAPPVMSVFERSQHKWVQLDGTVEHFQELPIIDGAKDLPR